MPSELASATLIAPRKRTLVFELALVVLVALAVLLPGIWSYSLVDPWETHYGEVSRMMLQNHDWVHTEWPQDSEGFRSKPVLMFWMMAGSMRALGLAADGGYSGEMVHDATTMIAIRLPFVLGAIGGLVLMWWMLARLVSRRLAWLALLVVGSCPFMCLIARQAIPDMPLTACVIGALSLFAMAIEDGERPIAPLHVHHEDDEAWYVLEGALGFVRGAERLRAGAGAAVLVPRGTPHSYWNAHSGLTRYVIVMTPRIAALVAAVHRPDAAGRLPEVFRAHASELLA